MIPGATSLGWSKAISKAQIDDLDLGGALVLKAKLPGSTPGKVDDTPLGKGPTVVHSHSDASTVFKIGHSRDAWQR